MNLAAVRAFATDRRSPSASLFVLLNPLAELQQDNPLLLETLSSQLGEEAVFTMLTPDLAHTPDLCPALVTLAGPGVEPPNQLLKVLAHHVRQEAQQQQRYICGLLISSVSAERVAAHLLSLGHMPTDHGAVYFPIHEPLRLELLQASINSGEQDVWWPIGDWLYPDSNGEGQIISAKSDQTVTLDEVAVSVQYEVPLVDALLRVWRVAAKSMQPSKTVFEPEESLLPPYAAALAYFEIQKVRNRWQIGDRDILVLAGLQLTVHPQLSRHSQVNALINDAIARQMPLMDAFQSYTDRDWDRIVSELIQAGDPL